MTAAEELRAAAMYLHAMADEDDLYTASGGCDFGPMAPELARAVASLFVEVAENAESEGPLHQADATEEAVLVVARLINPKEQ